MTATDKFSDKELIDHVYTDVAGLIIREGITDWGDFVKWRQLVDSMAQPVKLVYRIGILNMQVTNGGFIQYFDNGYGIFAYETLNDFKTIGAQQSYDILKEILEIVNYKKLSIDKFVEFVKQREYDINETIEDRLDKIDTLYYNLENDENLEHLVGTYLRQHINEIK